MLSVKLKDVLIWLWPVWACITGYLLWRVARLKRDMKASNHRLELALAGTKVGFWDWSVDSDRVIRNRGYAKLLGLAEGTVTDHLIIESQLIHPEDIPRLKTGLEEYLAGTRDSYEVAYRLMDSSGQWRWVLDRGVIVERDSNNRPLRIIGITVDIHDQKVTEFRLQELSYTDPVTGLYNRTYFNKAVQELDRADALPLSIIMGDLNGLKLTNDTFGHAAGDDLLIAMADVLRANCRKTDIITRWGGDEFAIILPNTGEQEALAVCDRIRAACEGIHDQPIRLSIALGVATRRTLAEPLREIVRSAEAWMYQHKLAESDDAMNTLVASIKEVLDAKYEDGLERGARQEKLALRLGRALGLRSRELEELALLARMHDVGHVMTPEEVLQADTRSFEDEQIFRQHVESGYRVARAIPQLRPIAETILAHHEHWDGSGYPRGLAGTDIPLNARIIAIVDAFDNLVQEFTELGPLSRAEALKEIARHAGTKFDPRLVAVFTELMEENAHQKRPQSPAV